MILHADARFLPLADGCIDAICTDPPYNLSSSGKRDRDCFRRVVAQFAFPNDDNGNAELGKCGALPVPSLGGAALRGVPGTVGVDGWVGVPEGAVDLKCAAIGEQEVHAGDESTANTTDCNLPFVPDSDLVEHLGHYVLQLADGGDTPFCDGTCRCFTEPSPGVVAVAVSLACPTTGDLPSYLLSGRRAGNPDVWPCDHTAGKAEGPSSVLACGATERRAVLRLDLLGRTGELRIADRAGKGDPLPMLRLAARPVGAGTRAGGLTTESQPARISVIDGGADRTFTLDLPRHAFDFISEGRAKGFMGKEWDGWDSPAAFERWCLEWAREAYRVLKPGGHLLAFGGTRTWHRLTCAIEDAGFEIRDTITWLYGSGFPKSLDVSKAIDKAAGAEREVIGRYASPEGTTGLNSRDDEFGFGLGDMGKRLVTAAATDDARRWQGWGTALKPASEPIVVARKPLSGTVAANVIAHGTGALNIDACRVAGNVPRTVQGQSGNAGTIYGADQRHLRTFEPNDAGRWPTNVILSHPGNDTDGDLCANGCIPGCPVADLDAQSGVLTSGANPTRRSADKFRDAYGEFAGQAACTPARSADSGGASRFFPTFRYQAKADTAQRPRADGTAHPTVKPLDLMRWLVRLVTPPGGLVLDPFAGSGTTGEACIVEGFRCVLIERDATYLPLINARVSKPIQPVLDLFGGLP